MGRISEGQCGNCKSVLEPALPNKGNGQYEDAFDLALFPGYGEKIDGFCNVYFNLCSECSDKFIKLFPDLYENIITEAERLDW